MYGVRILKNLFIPLVGSAQRGVQMGVAKKIKNGARKIVLDKAEEARVAAFSAFKSLGFNVPQLAPPMLGPVASDSSRLEAGGTSSGSDASNTNNSFVDVNHMDRSGHDPLANERKDMEKTPCNDVMAEEKLRTAMSCSMTIEKPVTPVESSLTTRGGFNVTLKSTENTVTATSSKLQNTNDRTGLHDRFLSHGTKEQFCTENMVIGKMDNPCQRGPINAACSPGGFDSFLDLWDSTLEFYFDIHYNKRLELNSAAPFEIHGIAICWENSPVHYINLPKDLLMVDNREVDNISLSARGNKHKFSSSKTDLEIVRHRWSRITKIMGKKDGRKFSWNLKTQIQVLKKPAVSVQRFGCLDNIGNHLELSVVDNSHVLLPPIHVKDAIDLCIVSWILWPDEERSSSPNLEKVKIIKR